MSRAEITRIRVSLCLSVKVMCSSLASSVSPRACKRASVWLCLESPSTRSGSLKKMASASDWPTLCFSEFFRELPSFQSKPTICAQFIMNVYYRHIRRRQQVLTSAGTATPFALRLRLHSKGAHAAIVSKMPIGTHSARLMS